MERNITISSSQEGQTIATRSQFVLWLKRHQLVAFFAITFAITWGGWFLLLALQSGVLPFKLDSESLGANLMFRLSGWGPTIAAIVLTALLSGKAGLREFFSRIVRWRVGLQWYAVALFSLVVIALAVMALYTMLIGPLPANPYITAWYSPILLFVPAVLISVGLAGISEEPGWRGYALPRLLSRHNALLAAVLLGLIWGLWHMPIYILDADGPLNFLLLMLQAPALSIFITWVYLHTKRSTLVSILFHGAIDGTWVLFLNNSNLVQVNVLITVVMWVAVAVVLVISGPRLQRKQLVEQNLY
jgi:membrane protease YdiL (CAAX protease family)